MKHNSSQKNLQNHIVFLKKKTYFELSTNRFNSSEETIIYNNYSFHFSL